jgi:hypothetical protein
MGSMCSQEKPNPCIFDGEIITCKDEINGNVSYYSLNQQEEISYIKKMYIRDNFILTTQVFVFIIILFLIYKIIQIICY